MKKERGSGFICGLYPSEHEYHINGVHYVVEAKFMDWKIRTNPSLKDRLERVTKNGFVPLKAATENDKMDDEYMCLTAGKEDNNAVK